MCVCVCVCERVRACARARGCMCMCVCGLTRIVSHICEIQLKSLSLSTPLATSDESTSRPCTSIVTMEPSVARCSLVRCERTSRTISLSWAVHWAS